MEINSERFKSLVDKIFGLREDLEELEGVIFAITEADKSEPQDWLEVYLRDKTEACVMLANKRNFILHEIARLAKELCEV
ncbi:MAG: hypothetical protein E7105_06435 [Prevotella sp.]|nr:hypothetical protein [Prevotella sp.]